MRPFAILGLFILLFASCTPVDEPNEGNEGDYVELTFKIATSSINSRGNVSENPYDTQNWTQAEKAVDGRIICNLSAYLYDKTTKAIYKASDDCISISPQANTATVTFDQRLNLKPGDYTLMVVANNSDPKINDITCGVTSWKDSSYEELMNNIIAISSDNVSPKNTIQPLSLMKDITLDKGNNYITGELKRTYSRVRITIKNNSTELPLKVKDLSLSNNFTQTQAYVFDDNSNRKYFGSLGAPLTTSQHALQPFTPNSDDGSLSIDCQSSSVVFDGYILESQLSGNNVYQYTPNIAYESEAEPVSRASDDEAPWIEVRDPANIVDGEYLICDYASYVYITTLNKTLEAGTVYGTYFYKNADVDDAHVWLISKTSDGKYYIKNKATGQYMQDPTTSYVGLNADNPFAFTISSHSHPSYSTYLEIKGSSLFLYPSYFYVYGYSSYSSSTRIVLYRRASQTPPSTSISFNEPITLKIIDPNTNQASDTKEIKRNAFIDIYVTVNYNTSTGEISYIVNDWNQGGGDILFD